MGVLYPVEVLPTADSSSAVSMTKKEDVLNFQEIKNNTHTALASVLSYNR
jgi:hypothetical protein